MKTAFRVRHHLVFVEVTPEVYEYLLKSRRKAENLRHEQRRHWVYRPFDEEQLVNSTSLVESPEEIYFEKEMKQYLKDTLAACTPVQRERFLLHALDGLSFSEIARRQQCSKYAVRDSIQAVRKKFFSFFEK